MTDFLYKFRSTEKFFEYKELENQELYFVSLKELNDPMEGYKNIVWRGDEIVWKNLLTHYLLCKYYYYFSCIDGKVSGFNENEIPIFSTISEISADERIGLFDLFFRNKRIHKLIKILALNEREVSQHELAFHLGTIHFYAMYCINSYLQNITFISRLDVKEDYELLLLFIERIDEDMNQFYDVYLKFDDISLKLRENLIIPKNLDLKSVDEIINNTHETFKKHILDKEMAKICLNGIYIYEQLKLMRMY